MEKIESVLSNNQFVSIIQDEIDINNGMIRNESEADFIVRGFLSEFGIACTYQYAICVSIENDLLNVLLLDKTHLNVIDEYSFDIEFMRDYERLVKMRSDLHELQMKFVLS